MNKHYNMCCSNVLITGNRHQIDPTNMLYTIFKDHVSSSGVFYKALK